MLDKFINIGYYYETSEGCVDVLYEGIRKSDRVSLVYMMVVDDEIKYIGKTIQGYVRPLSYHKNPIMVDVNDGIFEACTQGKTVKVYVRKFDEPLVFEGLELDICEAYEQALISKYKPEWNNHIR